MVAAPEHVPQAASVHSIAETVDEPRASELDVPSLLYAHVDMVAIIDVGLPAQVGDDDQNRMTLSKPVVVGSVAVHTR